MLPRQLGYGLRSEAGRVHTRQEGFSHGGGEAVFSFIGDSLVATVIGALDGSPFNITGLAGDRGAFLGGVVLGEGFRPHFVQPDEAELAVGLLALKADRKIRRLVSSGADQHAIVVELVSKDLFLDSQWKQQLLVQELSSMVHVTSL